MLFGFSDSVTRFSKEVLYLGFLLLLLAGNPATADEYK